MVIPMLIMYSPSTGPSNSYVKKSTADTNFLVAESSFSYLVSLVIKYFDFGSRKLVYS